MKKYVKPVVVPYGKVKDVVKSGSNGNAVDTGGRYLRVAVSG